MESGEPGGEHGGIETRVEVKESGFIGGGREVGLVGGLGG